MTISNQPAHEIDQEVNGTAMARMLDLRNVLELVNNGLDNSALIARLRSRSLSIKGMSMFFIFERMPVTS